MPEHAWKYCPECSSRKNLTKLSTLYDKCPNCSGPLREGYSDYARGKGAGRKKAGGKKSGGSK
jgi:hypothetical protein